MITKKSITKNLAVSTLISIVAVALPACSESTGSPTVTASAVDTDRALAPAQPLLTSLPPQAPPPPDVPEPAQPRLASDPAQLADDLIADELTLRDPSSTEAAMAAAARRQQVAYRAIGRNPGWDPITRPRIPPSLIDNYDRNVEARRQLAAMHTHGQPTLPAWRINPPTPASELLGYYRQAESATGVGWNYLAAINMIETAFGRIAGVSTAGAQGPMQFMPATFAAFGEGGDVLSPHDSIMAAGRYLAANRFAGDPDFALFRYNNSNRYVRAVHDYAAVIAADPTAFDTYHRWDVYYWTTAGDVILPIGYESASRIPVDEYLATHPQ
ncbi:MAG: lytic transglycosylase domain-containing protein [Actinomycetia bacterium]|nr:lytic transglycosylase domain-containing protein [Actinomycetes bacterium]